MRMTFEEAKMILENYIYDITRVGEELEAFQTIIEYSEKAYKAGYEAGIEDTRINIQYLRNCTVKKSDVIINDVEVILDNLRNAKEGEQ